MLKVMNALKKLPLFRGQIYLASVPFKISNTPNFFYCYDELCKNENNNCWLSNGKKIKLQINRKAYCKSCTKKDFNMCKGVVHKYKLKDMTMEERTDSANSYNLINKIKLRPYLILSFEMTKDIALYEDYVFGVPIYSLKEKHTEDEEFMGLIKSGGIVPFYYIDEKTNGISKPSFADLCYITPIHKDNLISLKGYLEPEDLYQVNQRIITFLDLYSFNNSCDLSILKLQKEHLEKQLNIINNNIEKIERDSKNKK
ncbi:hypothetical protein [Clostridium sp. YIM B02551]|uniref:hypothetical protein n=1 Tax=Clostridium sp. YIM B02551 TaxID=2910679 RepID=UPI001EEA5B77|nr:hypothetical protein [Clostridium sp. YIM B02551]